MDNGYFLAGFLIGIGAMALAVIVSIVFIDTWYRADERDEEEEE